MKALPLWQPWASLVAVGAKRVETRHWPAPPRVVGQRIAIHATKTPAHLRICDQPPFCEYVALEELPLGAIVATAVLARSTEITERSARELEDRNPHEFAFGDYTPGRFAWVLADVTRLPTPVEFRGSQGIFDVPDALIGHRASQGSLL